MPRKTKIQIGDKFNDLTVIESTNRRTTDGRIILICKCDCGRLKETNSNQLLSNQTKSCGFCKRSTLPKDLTGQIFGKLTVIEKAPNMGTKTAWFCRCECGNEKSIKTSQLLQKKTSTCGCGINYNKINLINKKFNRVTVRCFAGTQNGHKNYICDCSCGNEFITEGSRLISGRCKSCGCLCKESIAKIASSNFGAKNHNWKGGTSADYSDRNKKEYNQWKKIVKKEKGCVCDICGDIKRIEVHHLQGFLAFPELRFDPSNGIPLCNLCHKIFHSIYGSGDTTKEQYENFKQKVISGDF